MIHGKHPQILCRNAQGHIHRFAGTDRPASHIDLVGLICH